MDSIEPYTNIQEYATDLGNAWGVGTKKDNNGLVIVVCAPKRIVGIATGYGTELILTDSICKQIIDKKMISHFKDGYYFKGTEDGVKSLILEWK